MLKETVKNQEETSTKLDNEYFTELEENISTYSTEASFFRIVNRYTIEGMELANTVIDKSDQTIEQLKSTVFGSLASSVALRNRAAPKKSAWIRRRVEVLNDNFEEGEADPIAIEDRITLQIHKLND